MNIPAAQIYFHSGDAYIGTMSDSRGMLVDDGPIRIVRNYKDHLDILGREVTEAMKGSRTGVPRPSDTNALVYPYIESAGVKSWEEFAKASVRIGIRTAEGQRKAMLWLPVKSGKHMEPAEDAIRYFSVEESPESIAALIVELANQAGHNK